MTYIPIPGQPDPRLHQLTHVPMASDGILTPACTCGWYSPNRSHSEFERHLTRLREREER